MTRAWRFAVEHYLVMPLGGVIALVWANTGGVSYFRLAQALAFSVNDVGIAFGLAYLAQEVIEAALPGGTLHPLRRTVVPVIAALGGTLGAIAVYSAYIQAGDEEVLAQGWPIACAVDILYCVAIARFIFRRGAAVTFLLVLAIASDCIGLTVISPRYHVAYQVAPFHPVVAAVLFFVGIGVSALLRRSRVSSVWPYLGLSGPLCWLACYSAGVHPAVALLPIVPFLRHTARSDVDLATGNARGTHESAAHFEYVFKYPVQLIAFLFGFVNTGVLIRGFDTGSWAVLVASLVGRPAGILAAVGIAVAAGLQLPRHIGWREIVVIAVAASASLAFGVFFATAVFPTGPLLIETKIGAILTVVGLLLTVAAARLLRVGRFANLLERGPRPHTQHAYR